MLTSYASHDHRGVPERQRRSDSGSLSLSQVTKNEGYMATCSARCYSQSAIAEVQNCHDVLS
jgi:hypothetical protein